MAAGSRPGRPDCPGGGGLLTVGIVTDSAASLPADVAADGGVKVVPMWLTIGGQSVHDGDLSLDQVVERLGEGLSTSGPTPGEFAAAIEAADSGDGVAILTLSAQMSSTHDSARLAATLAADDDIAVQVLDTGTAAGAEGLVVLAAARRAAEGASLDEVMVEARRVAAVVRLVATLPTLEQLARGGRVPGAAAWAGRWLNVNPLFQFREGRARPLRPALSHQAALERIVSIWAHRIRQGAALHVAAMHAQDPEGAAYLLDHVSERVKPEQSFVGSFSPVMVAHTGPGLVGLAWWFDDGDEVAAMRR